MAKYNSQKSGDATPTATDVNSTKPWLKEFRQYLDGHDEVPSDMTVVQWWGGKPLIDITCQYSLMQYAIRLMPHDFPFGLHWHATI